MQINLVGLKRWPGWPIVVAQVCHFHPSARANCDRIFALIAATHDQWRELTWPVAAGRI